ncbi:MAG: class I SAM-dependent methyltransferase [Myxococcota bacterium]
MSRLRDALVSQLAKPRGVWTEPMSRLLNRGNRLITAHTLGALELDDESAVLEVGFGGGVGLEMVRAHVPKARLVGIDVSADVVRRGAKRFPELDLRHASADMLPFGEEFDAVFAVNVAYFWESVPNVLRELHRVLRPGGRLALGVRPAATCARLEFARSGHREWEPRRYGDALEDSGFVDVRVTRMPDPGGGANVVLGFRAPAG